MKKLLLLLLLVPVISFGQNKYRYVYHMYGGITVGGGSTAYDANTPNVTIDSLINDAGVLKFYSGGAEIPVSGNADSSLYVTITRLTDSLNLLRTALDLKLNAADTVSGSTLYHMLADTVAMFVFGSQGDSTMFNKGQDNFGCFRTKQDSLDVTSLEKLRISSGDTLLFNVYCGVYQTATATDSLFTGPQTCVYGVSTAFVPNNLTVIPPEMDVWIGLPADQTFHKPVNFVMQLNGKKIRE